MAEEFESWTGNGSIGGVPVNMGRLHLPSHRRHHRAAWMMRERFAPDRPVWFLPSLSGPTAGRW